MKTKALNKGLSRLNERNLADYFWASEEFNAKKAWMVNMYNGRSFKHPKRKKEPYVRAVANF